MKPNTIAHESEHFYAVKTDKGYDVFQNGATAAMKVATINVANAFEKMKREIERRENLLKYPIITYKRNAKGKIKSVAEYAPEVMLHLPKANVDVTYRKVALLLWSIFESWEEPYVKVTNECVLEVRLAYENYDGDYAAALNEGESRVIEIEVDGVRMIKTLTLEKIVDGLETLNEVQPDLFKAWLGNLGQRAATASQLGDYLLQLCFFGKVCVQK